MDRGLILLLAAAVVASGCSQAPLDGSDNTPDIGNKGLMVTGFHIADSTIKPGEQTPLVLELRNFHRKEIDMKKMKIVNTGLLDASFQSCSPPDPQPATKLPTKMTCRWTVSGLTQEEMQGFESKPQSLTALLKYTASMKNMEPLKVEFRSYDDIQSSESISKTFSNGEVKVKMETESPINLDGGTVDITVSSTGDGRVTEFTGFDFSPSSVFSDCSAETPVKPDSTGEYRFSCSIDEDSQVTRNLYMSTHYKYVNQKTLSMKAVSRE